MSKNRGEVCTALLIVVGGAIALFVVMSAIIVHEGKNPYGEQEKIHENE